MREANVAVNYFLRQGRIYGGRLDGREDQQGQSPNVMFEAHTTSNTAGPMTFDMP